MWSWYQQQIRTFGLLKATLLLWRVASSRIAVDLSNRLLPAKVVCPCCGWSGRRFYDYIEYAYTIPNAACPNCDSHPRHRQFFLWLNSEYRLTDKSGVGVVFAPERALAKVWQHSPRMRIVRVDIETTRRPDLIVDIQKLPLSPDEIDFVWCHHVLEHVEDDGAAMKELNRILRPATGELIVSVPMNGLAQTTENGFPDPKDCGHWRIYGHDFVDKLKVSGFEVREVDFDVTEEQAAKFAIVADAPFYICRKPVSTEWSDL